MKSTINYFYNLFPDKIIVQKNFCYFWIDDEKYYFVPFNNDLELVKKIYKKLLLEQKRINFIILNKDNNFITEFKNAQYILLKVNCLENEIVNVDDFQYIFIDGQGIDWGKVWSLKIDYLEYQISQRGLGKDSILNSFSYYVGLAENAIAYYNMIEIKDVSVGIQHKRIYANNYEINYYNPINMIIDYNVRDISEFIKFSFFEGNLNEDKIFDYINKLNLNNTMMNLLYIRLLFPTYYFDCYEKILSNEDDEKKLLNIVNKSLDYKIFLKKFYLYYFKAYNLLKIDWIVDN